MSPLDRLADALRAEGGLLAGALAAPPADEPLLDAAGSSEHGLVLAAVREGYLLHYGEPRIVRRADADLALLGGDRLYALGLERLAALGDLGAVARLADLISCCAEAHADDRPQAADAAWRTAVAAFAGSPGAGA
jgi:hypothetical protein